MKPAKKQKIVHYDPTCDVLFFGVTPGIEEEVVEIAPGINAELGADGRILGVEILRASKMLRPMFTVPQQAHAVHATHAQHVAA